MEYAYTHGVEGTPKGVGGTPDSSLIGSGVLIMGYGGYSSWGRRVTLLPNEEEAWEPTPPHAQSISTTQGYLYISIKPCLYKTLLPTSYYIQRWLKIKWLQCDWWLCKVWLWVPDFFQIAIIQDQVIAMWVISYDSCNVWLRVRNFSNNEISDD